jgi:endonuclease/exonuclease/phosphatase family metal-dependent hydrolase
VDLHRQGFGPSASRPGSSPSRRAYVPPPNDHLSRAFDAAGLIPDRFKGADDFLDIVTWNIRYFHHHDPARVERVTEILSTLNADIVVLQEILEGSLDPVVAGLAQRDAGYYQVAYGTTGGNQRVAIMYDLDWVRAKDDVTELFGKGRVKTPEGKEVFWRLPLRAYLTVLSEVTDPFDFQLVGVHLKSQRGGGDVQRELAADCLGEWLNSDAQLVDADVIIMGDWNEPPDAPAWRSFHDLESAGRARFRSINTKSAISHLYFKNKRSIGSRLDLVALSMAAKDELVGDPTVVRWRSLDDLLDTQPKAAQIKRYIKEISMDISDHMPVVTRFFFEERS